MEMMGVLLNMPPNALCSRAPHIHVLPPLPKPPADILRGPGKQIDGLAAAATLPHFPPMKLHRLEPIRRRLHPRWRLSLLLHCLPSTRSHVGCAGNCTSATPTNSSKTAPMAISTTHKCGLTGEVIDATHSLDTLPVTAMLSMLKGRGSPPPWPDN